MCYLCGMKPAILLLAACAVAASLTGQGRAVRRGDDAPRRFRVMEWNCENVFDTVHTAGHDDTDFTPAGAYAWDGRRYWSKLGRMGRVILDAAGLTPIDLIGLCEVEGDSVVRDLVRRTRMASLRYEYVVTSGPDVRGIEVALIYNPGTFRLVGHRDLRLAMPDGERPTRDVLTVTGILPTGDTLDVAVVHFPSRRGGARASAPHRMLAADAVAAWADSLRHLRSEPNLLVMGDCNDTPADASLKRMARAGLDILTSRTEAPYDIRGTYHYQREWSQIDNILLSHEAVQRYGPSPVQIFAPDYLLEDDSRGLPIPRRTYLGTNYHGGTSDHLPLLLDMWY